MNSSVSRPGNSRGCLPLKARFIWFGFTRFLTVGMLQNTEAGKFEGEEIVDNDSLRLDTYNVEAIFCSSTARVGGGVLNWLKPS